MNTTLDYLFRVESPWIYVGPGEAERRKWNPSHFYARPDYNVCVRQLRGPKMRTTKALMNEFGAALQFFEGFGENWHALEECLEYMDEWLPAHLYVLVIERAEELLQEEPEDQMSTLLTTLHKIGEWWAKPIKDNDRFNRPAIPFHVLINVSEGVPASAQSIIHVARATGVPVRA
jgi:hypothetical protein